MLQLVFHSKIAKPGKTPLVLEGRNKRAVCFSQGSFTQFNYYGLLVFEASPFKLRESGSTVKVHWIGEGKAHEAPALLA